MGWSERVRRYAVMLLGVFAISMGVALITKSATGTSAISVVPYTLSLALPALSYGAYVALFNALLVALQAALLRGRSDWFDLAQQLVLCFFFGSFVDLSMFLLGWFDPQAYPARLATLGLGVVVLAFGAYLTLISHVGVMAGDGFARALSRVTGREFGIMRVASDTTMAAVAVALNLALFRALVSVREGTVVTALFTGLLVGLFSRHLKGFEHALLPTNG